MNLKLYQIFKRRPITHSNQGQAPHQLFARLDIDKQIIFGHVKNDRHWVQAFEAKAGVNVERLDDRKIIGI